MTSEIHIQYFAILRDERGCSEETLNTDAKNAAELYQKLQKEHGFRLSQQDLKVAINDEFTSWQTPLQTKDKVVFIPPVTGG